MFRLSTSEMPETAASPTLATIMVSAMPDGHCQQLLDHQRHDQLAQILL